MRKEEGLEINELWGRLGGSVGRICDSGFCEFKLHIGHRAYLKKIMSYALILCSQKKNTLYPKKVKRTNEKQKLIKTK